MTKKKITYTLIGEGFAEYRLIPAYMEWVGSQNPYIGQVVRSRIQIPDSAQSSVSKILQEAKMFCVQSFADAKNPCDLFIAGIDLDQPDFTDDLERHGKRISELKEKMGNVYAHYKDQIVLYVPIQTIDCWVCYVKHNATVNSQESVGKEEMKQKVYGTKKPDRRRIEQVVKEAVANADFNKLARQSKSFALFHAQVKDFFDRFTQTA